MFDYRNMQIETDTSPDRQLILAHSNWNFRGDILEFETQPGRRSLAFFTSAKSAEILHGHRSHIFEELKPFQRCGTRCGTQGADARPHVHDQNGRCPESPELWQPYRIYRQHDIT